MNLPRPHGLLLAAILGLYSHPLLAQDATDKAAAEALFTQGRDLLASGKIDEACKRFEASQALDAGLGTLLHLADCYERADRRASAWATFKEAASLAESRGDAKRSEVAMVRAQALQSKLAYIQLDIPADFPADAQIARNGRPVAKVSWGVPVPVDAGSWQIQASAPGFAAQTLTVEVKYGSTEAQHIAIPSLVPNPPALAPATPGTAAVTNDASSVPMTPAPADTGDTQRTLGLILGGVGVVGLAVAGTFAVLAAGSNNKSFDDCSDDAPNSCGVTGKQLRDDALGQALVASIASVAGAVALGGGTIIFLTAPSPTAQNAQVTLGLRGTW
jgi:hypothetical protein